MEAVSDLQRIANKLEDVLGRFLDGPLAEEGAIADCAAALRQVIEDENDRSRGGDRGCAVEAVSDLQRIANKLEDVLDAPLAEKDEIADCAAALRDFRPWRGCGLCARDGVGVQVIEEEDDWHPLDRWAPANRAFEGGSTDATKKTSET